jgi:hypothetical protein
MIILCRYSYIFGDEDAAEDREYHHRLAEFAASSKTLWAWEELYHRAQAEEWEAVLRLGTQEHFRNQFMYLRPATAIFEDINFCLEAARKQYDGLAIIRALLIEKELSDRKECLDSSDVNLPRLLLAASWSGRGSAFCHGRKSIADCCKRCP